MPICVFIDYLIRLFLYIAADKYNTIQYNERFRVVCTIKALYKSSDLPLPLPLPYNTIQYNIKDVLVSLNLVEHRIRILPYPYDHYI